MQTYEVKFHVHGLMQKKKKQEWKQSEQTSETWVSSSEIAKYYNVPPTHIMKILLRKVNFKNRQINHENGDICIPLKEWKEEYLRSTCETI